MREFKADILYRSDDEQLRFLPEGPHPCGDALLSWVAIQHGADAKAGSLNVLDLRTRTNTTYPLEGRPGFAFPTDRPETFLIGLERRVVLFDLKRGEQREVCGGIDSDVDGTIINDGCLFEDNLIFGTKDLEFREKKAGLYLWRAADEKLIRLRDDQICSNGKFVLQSDGLRLVDIDSPTKQIVEYPLDLAAGTLGTPRVVVDLTDGEGVPDGMIATPDQRSLIVAIYNPGDVEEGEVRQYSMADGRLESVWRCEKSPRVTCPQLVHVDGRDWLVVTTAIEDMPPEQLARCPNAGSLFIAPAPS